MIKYTVNLSDEAINDIICAGKYIGENFKYEELVLEFIDTIQDYVEKLDVFPYRLPKTGFLLDGNNIYMRSFKNYLFFIRVLEIDRCVEIIRILHEGMNWEFEVGKTIIQGTKKFK